MNWNYRLSKRWSLLTGALVGAVMLGACSTDRTAAIVAAPGTSTAAVIVSPGTANVTTGGTVQLTATPRDSAGNPLTGKTVTWATSSANVASVSATGLVTAVAAGNATVTATSDGTSGTAVVAVTAPSQASVATITLTPGSNSLVVGNTVQLTVTLRDSANNVLAGRTVTWSSSSGTIASVSAAGLVSANAAGSATITAASGGRSGTASVSVQTGSTASPFLTEDFSTYSSTANLLADPLGLYAPSENINVGPITLDPTLGYGGSPQSMRYTFADRTLDVANRCQDITISRAINTPGKRHLWIEVYVRFSASWRISAPAAWGCTSNPDYKLFIIPVNGGNSRFNLLTQNPHFVWGYPGVEDAGVISNPTPSAVWDGQWHRYRMEISVSSSTNAADAVARFWLDNTRLSNFTNLVINRSDIPFIALGRNLNQGPGQAQYVNFGAIRVWDQYPGW